MAEDILASLAAEATLVVEPEAEPSLDGAPPKSTISIVGPGRVGQAMGKLLHTAGYSIGFVAARRISSARKAVEFIGSGTACKLYDPVVAGSDIILLTVSDGAIAQVAAEWSKWGRAWRGRIVLHSSGALPAAELLSLKKHGASIGSLHPFQTVPSAATGYRNLRGTIWSIEGDVRAQRAAKQVALALEGLTFRIKANQKTLYHAAAVISCGAVVALLDHSAQMLRRSGVPAKIVRPMLGQFATETVRNFVSLGGPGALTGPAARGDWSTVEAHIRILRQRAPQALPVYRELVRAMANLAGKNLPRGLKL
jgi:predicted short-subunit dehydrogenase-like oxidoreductase (DUF2520 family)